MVLRMARPQKHRKTGIYWFRRRVPKDIRPLLSRGEITRTLATRDPVEAAARHRRIAAEVEAQFAGFHQGERTLTHKQTLAIAGEIYREIVVSGEDDPGPADARERALASDQFAVRAWSKRVAALAKFGNRRDEFLERKGILLSDGDRRALLLAIGEASVQANEQLLKNAKGDYRPDPNADRFPVFEPPEKEKAASRSLVSLYDLYVGQLGHADGTIKRWRPKYIQFEEFIAPKAWHQATKPDVIAWMDELLNPRRFPDQEKVKPVTVRDVHFAALRALYAFLEERDWGKNPFTGVRVRMPKYEERTRTKDLTEDEAKIILRAALEPPNKRMAPEYQAPSNGFHGFLPTPARG